MSAILDAVKTTVPADVYSLPLKCVATCSSMTMVKTARLGTCMTLSDERVFDFPDDDGEIGHLGTIDKLSVEEIFKWTDSHRGIERSFGVAALNGAVPLNGKKYFIGNALHIAAELGKGKVVTTVGHFPHTDLIKKNASEFYVLEKRPQEGDCPAEDACKIIPNSDVVAITGVTCLNDTLEPLLKFKKPGSVVIIVGPSVPLSSVLFDFGVDILGGAWVEDEEAVYRKVLQGGSPRLMKEHLKTVLYPKDPELLKGFEEIKPIYKPFF